jgi:hypothetical protein
LPFDALCRFSRRIVQCLHKVKRPIIGTPSNRPQPQDQGAARNDQTEGPPIRNINKQDDSVNRCKNKRRYVNVMRNRRPGL